MPFLWSALAPLAYGQALIRQGKLAEGMVPLRASLAFWDASGGKVRSPTLKAQLAEAMALSGDVDAALALIEEQIEQIERPGWQERLYYAEILRLKGWMLSLRGDVAGAERELLASLDWARRQRAKSWELRTAVSLARLWEGQDRRREAYEVLAPVHGWFTEGFDGRDMREAECLLAELR
jgi:predicted ATPase